jgi:ribonuclease HII
MVPNLELESDLCRSGPVVGLDEVGKGSWAGPLCVGAVVIEEHELAGLLGGDDQRSATFARIRDSKVLSEAVREELHDVLIDHCRWAVGAASHLECDELGMADAQRLATARALGSLRADGLEVSSAIVDGNWDFVGSQVSHVVMRVKADRECLSVAAASVIAKVQRDRLMRELAEHYPFWSLHSNKGYPCARHRAGLAGYGPSAIHRRSWVFMDKQPWSGVKRVSAHPSLF